MTPPPKLKQAGGMVVTYYGRGAVDDIPGCLDLLLHVQRWLRRILPAMPFGRFTRWSHERGEGGPASGKIDSKKESAYFF